MSPADGTKNPTSIKNIDVQDLGSSEEKLRESNIQSIQSVNSVVQQINAINEMTEAQNALALQDHVKISLMSMGNNLQTINNQMKASQK